MTAPNATESALREHLASWLGSARRRTRTILVHAQPSWTGPNPLDIDGNTVRIVEGISGLAALDAIESTPDGDFLAILTDLNEGELGSAVVLRSEHQRLTLLDDWSGVPALFGARDSNVPRQVRNLGPWVPAILRQFRRDRSYPAAPGGNLTPEHVIRSILMVLLGLERIEHLDIADALTPLDDNAVRMRLSDLDATARGSLIQAVKTHIDHHLAMALHAATVNSVSVIAVGLMAAELWANNESTIDPETAAARVRAEHYLGENPSAHAAARLGSAARLITRRWLASGDQHAQAVLEQAEQLCLDLGWHNGATNSDFLPTGLRQRVRQFAASITAVAAEPTATASLNVDAALTAIEAHGARALFERSLPTARMAVRLSRWLTTPEHSAGDLALALQGYISDSAWAEFALGDLWDGDPDPILAPSYKALALAVQARRQREDTTTAALVTGSAPPTPAVIPVEHLLEQLVVPLAARDRVLLIVLDGMNAATAIELASELPGLGWSELVRDDRVTRDTALAVFPTITEYSRSSLFAGELTRGNQQQEKARFAAAVHGRLFHKDDLRAEAGYALPPAVTAAIDNSGPKIVAAVLNTIDDALASADVDALRWNVRAVANLESLLGAARAAGRLVILTSDHGHIVERGSELRSVADASARWRLPESGPIQDDEVLLSGPRVLAPGGQAVLAVSDGVRYTSKKAGYHGGASLAEITIPVIVLKPTGAGNPNGWIEAPPQEPTWWNEPTATTTVATEPIPQPKKPSKKRQTSPDPDLPTLFDPEPTAQDDSPRVPTSVGARLVDSSTYLARRGLAGRHPVDDATMITIIDALVAGNGRAHRDTLAARVAISAHAFNGLLVTLRRVLNVDGYSVIDNDPDGVTVLLDLPLLREQFAI